MKKTAAIQAYKKTTAFASDLQALRKSIEQQRNDAILRLNEMQTKTFIDLGIKYEEQTWDLKTNKTGKPKKRNLKIADIERLQPFHWGYEFAEIFEEKKGFDAIITNPPWDIFKPNGKEFFMKFDDRISKKNMTIKEFKKVQAELLKNENIKTKWCQYLSNFPYVGHFYRKAEQYKNQLSYVNGKKAGSDTNLFKLFTEQCYNLLKEGGYCGTIIPSGIYTDLGAKQLRQLLFDNTEIKQLFSFANEKFIFEEVHHAFKFCLLTFEKGNSTEQFQAAFRINPREAVKADELDFFFKDVDNHVLIKTAMVKRLSPASLSVMEFRKPIDARIAEKMAIFPPLGEFIEATWNLKLTTEFHMTNRSYLFKTQSISNCIPLYEGKMIHQFIHQFSEPRYWIDINEGRNTVLGRNVDNGQLLDYQDYRLGFRAVASSTNARTIIVSILPKNVFCGNSLLVSTLPFYQNNK